MEKSNSPSSEKKLEKAGKIPYFKRLKTRLSMTVFIILGMLISVQSVYQLSRAYNQTVDDNMHIQLEEARNLAIHVENVFDKVDLVASNICNTAENTINTTPVENRSRKLAYQSLEMSVKNTDFIYGAGLYYEPNAFDGRDKELGRIAKYAEPSDDGSSISLIDEPDIDKEGENDWYVEPLNQNKTMVFEPYETDGINVVTLAKPIQVGGKAVGVINLDLDLSLMNDIVENSMDDSDKGKVAVLYASDGTIIASNRKNIKPMANIFDIDKKLSSVSQKTSKGEPVSLRHESGLLDNADSSIQIVPIKFVDGSVWNVALLQDMKTISAGPLATLIQTLIMNLVIIVVMVVIMHFFINKMVGGPLYKLAEILDGMSNYNLNLDKFGKDIAQLVSKGNEVSHITGSVKNLGNHFSGLLSSINEQAQSVASAGEEISATALRTADSADQVSDAVNSIAQGATSQAGETQTASESIENIQRLIKDMKSYIDTLSATEKKIVEKKDEGAENINKLTQSGKAAIEQFEKFKESMVKTEESMDKISNASDMIQSIADQTNLLALNAAIEAARAGEAGKGFAVVAEEIRKLAEQSNGFTEEIRNVLADLIESFKESIHGTEMTSAVLQDQNREIADTGSKFKEIEAALEESVKAISAVEDSANTVSEKNNDIVSVIENLSAIAQENAATTEQASASVENQSAAIEDISKASEELAQIAQRLQEHIAKFKF